MLVLICMIHQIYTRMCVWLSPVEHKAPFQIITTCQRIHLLGITFCSKLFVLFKDIYTYHPLRLTRQHFSNLELSGFSEPVNTVVSDSSFWLIGAKPDVVFCCHSPSTSRIHILCVCVLDVCSFLVTVVVKSGNWSYCSLSVSSN